MNDRNRRAAVHDDGVVGGQAEGGRKEEGTRRDAAQSLRECVYQIGVCGWLVGSRSTLSRLSDSQDRGDRGNMKLMSGESTQICCRTISLALGSRGKWPRRRFESAGTFLPLGARLADCCISNQTRPCPLQGSGSRTLASHKVERRVARLRF